MKPATSVAMHRTAAEKTTMDAGWGFDMRSSAHLTGQKGCRFMKTEKEVSGQESYWQLVFAQSKVNGGLYSDDQLVNNNWNWPQDTFLQRRLRQVRVEQAYDKTSMI